MVVEAKDDWRIGRHERIEQQAQQHTDRGPGRPNSPIEDTVVVLELRICTQSHDPQGCVTVRLPGAILAPINRILAQSHPCSLNSSSNRRRSCIIARGRLRMPGSFLAVGSRPSVPCLSFVVYRMDKVELRLII